MFSSWFTPDVSKLIEKKDVKGLLKFIQSGSNDPILVTIAIEALGEIGDIKAVQPLIDLLNNSGENKTVVKALGKLGDFRTADALICHIEKLKSLDDTYIYLHKNYLLEVANALCVLGDHRAVEYYYPLLGDDDSLQNILKSMLKFRNEKTDQLLLEYGRKLLNSIKNSKAKTPQNLLTSNTVNSLIMIGDIIFEDLLSLLESPNREMKYLAVNVLGKFGDNRAVAPLDRLLKDNDTSLHSAIVEALCTIEDKRAAESLLFHFKGKQIPDDVISYFGKVGFGPAVRSLINQIENPFSMYTIALIEGTFRKTLETSISEIDSQDLSLIVGLQDRYTVEYKYGGKLDLGYHPGSEDYGSYETWEENRTIDFVLIKNMATRELDRRKRL